MHENPPREVSKIVESISAKSKTVREMAAVLNERIEKFQNYLGKLPGRVESYCYGKHPDETPDGPPIELCLRLARDGKEWVLSCGVYLDSNDDSPISFKPLLDASLQIKLAAVKLFPDLLEAIERSQGAIAQQITATIDEFDDFAAKLNMQEKEGK